MLGWLAVLTSLLAWAPSFMPGAMSVIGLLLSAAALLLSVFSVQVKDGRVANGFYYVTLCNVLIGAFVINDAMRLWQSLELPFNTKLFLYGFLVATVVLSYILIRWRAQLRRLPPS